MQADPALVNRVAQSALVTLNLEDFRPAGEIVALDIQPQLFQGLILREKDFREFVKTHDWAQYAGKHVAVFCSADAIIPAWAYMLVGTALSAYTSSYLLGTPQELEAELYRRAFDAVDWSQYASEKIVLKGCGTVPASAYTDAVRRLMPHADKLMYGEPCSMVPLWRRPAAKDA